MTEDELLTKMWITQQTHTSPLQNWMTQGGTGASLGKFFLVTAGAGTALAGVSFAISLNITPPTNSVRQSYGSAAQDIYHSPVRNVSKKNVTQSLTR